MSQSEDPSLLIAWQSEPVLGLRWEVAGPAADPSRSQLWGHYQAAARVTAPNSWTLPGAPCGGSMATPALPRLLEPMAYFEKGLELFQQLPDPSPADQLVDCAMRLGRAQLALELAADQLKFSYQEAYDITCQVMGLETSQVVKPFGLVGRWLGAIGILGITNERWAEVQAVMVFLAEFLEHPLPPELEKEMKGFFAALLRRAAEEQSDPQWFRRLKERLPASSPLRDWFGEAR